MTGSAHETALLIAEYGGDVQILWKASHARADQKFPTVPVRYAVTVGKAGPGVRCWGPPAGMWPGQAVHWAASSVAAAENLLAGVRVS